MRLPPLEPASSRSVAARRGFGCRQSRGEAEQHRCADCRDGCEEQKAPVERDLEFERDREGQLDTDEDRHREPTQCEPEYGADAGQKQRFHEQLTNDREPSRTHGDAHRHFLAAVDPVAQKKCSEIDACDEQHQTDCDEQECSHCCHDAVAGRTKAYIRE